jgi:8-oxo-dGTP diphosphatase
MSRDYGARVLVNAEVAVAIRVGATGVHLTAARLLETSARPDLALVGASCHDEHELAHAVRIGVDFVVLGPVQDTPSHPGSPTLGWQRFAQLVHGYPLPVYAVGGLGAADFARAWSAGAHGIAAIRAAWLDQRAT